MHEVFFKDMGVVAYKDAWNFQEQLLQKNVQAKTVAKSGLSYSSNGTPQEPGSEAVTGTRHHLLLCEHPPVYTLGKSGQAGNVLISEAALKQKGIEYYQTNRGGDITFHGPGQIVGYPILDLEKY